MILTGVLYFLIAGRYSDGFRVGQLSKLSQRGLIFKTYEGELQLGFLENNADDGGVATRMWSFSVENDPEILKAIDEAILKAHRVKLYYKEKYMVIPWESETRYVVYKVEAVQ